MNGEWWVENRTSPPMGDYTPPEHTVAGTLSDSDTDKWSLDTIGNINTQSLSDSISDSFSRGPIHPATIWGINADQRSFSLLNCYTTTTTVHPGSLREGTQRWQVGTIIEGYGIWVEPEIVVDEINIEYQDLAMWAWDRKKGGVEPDFTDDGVILKISLIPNIEEALAHATPVQLSWQRNSPITDGPINVRPSATITISDTLKIAGIADKWVFPIGQLLSLLTVNYCGVTKVRARIANEQVNGRATYVDIRFQQAAACTSPGEKELDPHGRQLEMLATRTDLVAKGIDLTTLLSAFLKFQNNPKLSDALSHFLDSQAKAEVGEVDEALRCLFNAFENLHAVCFEGTIEDSGELGAALKTVIKATPVEYRDEISRRLGRKKPKPMGHKVQDLVDFCDETASRVLALRPRLITDASDARNEIAHANQSSASKWKRHLVLMDLQWLMRHAFLQLLGVQRSDCDDIFRLTGRPFSQYVGHQ